MAKTVIGLFSNHSEAQQAIQELVAAGFARKDIAVMERNGSSAPGAIADNLVGVPEEEARYYSEGITSGRTVVAIKTDDARAGEAVVVLERYGAKDCTSSEPIGQVGNGIKRGSGPSVLKLRLRSGDAAGVVARWFSA
jgi:hypothetical protein